MELLNILRRPDDEFSPIPFWFLNGELKQAEIKRQLADFKAHGISAVVLHPRIGLPKRIGYLSKEFFSYIRTAVTACQALDMRVVLYDEGMYPSGSACGQVAAGHPELASQGLALVSAAVPGDEVLAQTEKGFLVVRPSGGTIRGVHFGEDDHLPNAPKSADILNPEAVRRFMELTHEAYYRELAPYFGHTIIGFFTDEPNILGRCSMGGMMPWTKGFAQVFQAAGGKTENLAALFEHKENRDTQLYHALIIQRENEVYYAPLSAWCAEHGIALMGHPDRSDDIEREKHFHVPGQDLVYRQVAPETGDLAGADSTQGKCSADAARLLGRRRNSSECLGVCGGEKNPWSLRADDIKWFLDYLAVRGVNLYFLHAFYYSIKGARKDERPPDVGPNNIWWPHYTQWSTYLRRLSCLMTDAEIKADVAVLCRNRALMPEKVAPLFENQIGFQYIPESYWASCREEKGRLVCQNRRYSTVVGPEDRFPAVSRQALDAERDILCARPQPNLRCIRFMRCGTECRFLVNAGETDIDTTALLDQGRFGQYDLWTGEACRFDGSLYLPKRGSLLIFACTEAEYAALPPRKHPSRLPLPHFTLIEEDRAAVRRVYRAFIGRDPGLLEIRAEEMAELTVNGQSAGVSFWSPHRFDLSELLRQEQNELILTVTGSKANLYGTPVPYGLMENESD